MAEPRLLSIPEVRERLGVSRSTIYELFASRELGSVRINARRLVTERQLSDYLRRLESAAQ